MLLQFSVTFFLQDEEQRALRPYCWPHQIHQGQSSFRAKASALCFRQLLMSSCPSCWVFISLELFFNSSESSLMGSLLTDSLDWGVTMQIGVQCPKYAQLRMLTASLTSRAKHFRPINSLSCTGTLRFSQYLALSHTNVFLFFFLMPGNF